MCGVKLTRHGPFQDDAPLSVLLQPYPVRGPGAKKHIIPALKNMNTQTIARFRPANQPDKRPANPQRWSVADVEALFKLPFADLMFRAQQVHREHFDPNAVQLSTLLSIKTGGCSEDCGYCTQSSFHSAVENKKMLEVDEVVKAAKAAKDAG